MSKRRNEDKVKNWKNKAIARRKENDYLKSRNKELTKSRDNWKSKYLAEKAKNESSMCDVKKAKRHHYPLVVVHLLLELYRYGGMSLRSCRHTIRSLQLCMGLRTSLPSHNSIRNWLCKSGLYRVQSTEKQRGEYVVYVDESISFGSEKILLILGIKSDTIPVDRSVIHQDVEVLGVEIGKEWKGEQIAKTLSKIAVNKTIKYVVSDEGNNLKNAYKTLNYSHIEDCTHILANYLKRLYGTDEDFKKFSQLIGTLRQKWNLSKEYSSYMPPTMRGKMRFANIFPCVNWAKGVLSDWENLPTEVRQHAAFLKENSDFINELTLVEKIFKTVCQDLKNKGFGQVQHTSILAKLTLIQSDMNAVSNHKTKVFLDNVKTYLNNLETKREVLGEEFLLCSSDIIESYFGKFKAKINENSRSGLTEFIFTIATFGKSFSIEELQNALESIKCENLNLEKIKGKAA